MEVYKVFRRENGKLVSVLAGGKAKTTYPTGRMHYGRKWLVIRGYLPTAFVSLEDAQWLIDFERRGLEIWRCETNSTMNPRPSIDLLQLSKGNVSGVDWAYITWTWPWGTVFCRGIKPIERVYPEDKTDVST